MQGVGDGEEAGEGRMNRKIPGEQKAAETGNKNMSEQRVESRDR